MAKKWLDSVEKQKRRLRSNVCDKQRNRRTAGQTESTTKNNRLLYNNDRFNITFKTRKHFSYNHKRVHKCSLKQAS